MGGKPRKTVWIVWLLNRVDSRDDEPTKVMASSKGEAEMLAQDEAGWRFTVGYACRAREFYRDNPGWKGLV